MEWNLLEILGTIVGLLYLWLEYRASIYLWIAGIVMPAIYIVVYYRAGLYADFGINIYYLVAAIYGWCFWAWGGTRREAPPIARMPVRHVPLLLVVFVAALLGIAFALIRYTNSNVPWIDSFTTALSIVGLWMLARKYLEQWLVWIVVDVACCGLYVYKELYFTSVLYGLYAVIAIFGYLRWKQIMNEQWSANIISPKP
ncbi:MAG: nicotinamide riboside transporter PnuC [Mediterranea sp.]|jgi:nicotinamide mononucleotide transporter|nr:nicotinamide riboside transporter PnuC [Mediterranea sp.]